MKELKADHQDGKISDEKYNELSRQYMLKLKNIDASSRIRAMQGKQYNQNVNMPRSNRSNKKIAELNRKEDEELVKKYIVNPKNGSSYSKHRNKHVNNKGKYSIIAVIFLIIAFTAGIGFGVFNFDFKATSASDASVFVSDSAFPTLATNNTTNTSTNSSISTSSSSDSSTSTTDTGTQSATTSTQSSDSSSGSSSSGSSGSDSGSSSSGSSGSDSGSSSSGSSSGSST